MSKLIGTYECSCGFTWEQEFTSFEERVVCPDCATVQPAAVDKLMWGLSSFIKEVTEMTYSAIVTCDYCQKEINGNERRDWLDLSTPEQVASLHFCCWVCLADYAQEQLLDNQQEPRVKKRKPFWKFW